MKVSDFFKMAENDFADEMELMSVKGKEYTVSDADKLKNFKSIAERMKCEPEFVCMVYLLKHMDSIRNYVLTGTEASDEPIAGRIHDARNYLLLLKAILQEKNSED